MRIRSFEYESDVLRFHVRHAHVPGGNAAVDGRDVILPETKEREELDRRAGVCHCDRHMIRIEYHPVTPGPNHSTKIYCFAPAAAAAMYSARHSPTRARELPPAAC